MSIHLYGKNGSHADWSPGRCLTLQAGRPAKVLCVGRNVTGALYPIRECKATEEKSKLCAIKDTLPPGSYPMHGPVQNAYFIFSRKLRGRSTLSLNVIYPSVNYCRRIAACGRTANFWSMHETKRRQDSIIDVALSLSRMP